MNQPRQLFDKTTRAILMALLAAALYGISSPLAKLLLAEVPPLFMAALLYLGAGSGMLILNLFRVWKRPGHQGTNLTKREMPYIAGMIILDIAAPFFLMLGLTLTTAENVSLLNNFEIVATALVALYFFQEAVGMRMWLAIALITLATIILSVQDFSSVSLSIGSVFVIIACICWGFENNFTRVLSIQDPLRIVVLKGWGSGLGALLIAFLLKEQTSNLVYIVLGLALGFVAYGLSIFYYISAQRELGAARTSAYYAAAPFIGVMVSWIVLREQITPSFLIALIIMIIGTYLAATEKHEHSHLHVEETHTHPHSHADIHHAHLHEAMVAGEHSHEHHHPAVEHKHKHTPDAHHRHTHS